MIKDSDSYIFILELINKTFRNEIKWIYVEDSSDSYYQTNLSIISSIKIHKYYCEITNGNSDSTFIKFAGDEFKVGNQNLGNLFSVFWHVLTNQIKLDEAIIKNVINISEKIKPATYEVGRMYRNKELNFLNRKPRK